MQIAKRNTTCTFTQLLETIRNGITVYQSRVGRMQILLGKPILKSKIQHDAACESTFEVETR